MTNQPGKFICGHFLNKLVYRPRISHVFSVLWELNGKPAGCWWCSLLWEHRINQTAQVCWLYHTKSTGEVGNNLALMVRNIQSQSIKFCCMYLYAEQKLKITLYYINQFSFDWSNLVMLVLVLFPIATIKHNEFATVVICAFTGVVSIKTAARAQGYCSM